MDRSRRSRSGVKATFGLLDLPAMPNFDFDWEFPVPGVYVEIAADGTQSEYPLPPIARESGSIVYGLALTEDGSAFATGKSPDGIARAFGLNRQKRSWGAVKLPDFPSDAEPILIGASGNQLGFLGIGRWPHPFLRVRRIEVAAAKVATSRSIPLPA